MIAIVVRCALSASAGAFLTSVLYGQALAEAFPSRPYSLEIRAAPGSSIANLRSLPDSAAPAAIGIGSIAPDPAWISHHIMRRATPGPRATKGYVADALTLDVVGSGRNGPITADYGRSTTMIKRGYGTPGAAIGEMDGQLILMRQAGPTPTNIENASDLDGIQMNLEHVGDPGFLAMLEAHIARIDPTNYSSSHQMGLQIGVIDPFGRNGEVGKSRYSAINRMAFGFYAGAQKGNLNRAFYSANTGSGCWEDHAYFGGGGNPTFRVKGGCSGRDGAIVLGPDGGNRLTLERDASGNLLIRDKADVVKAAIRQDGTVVAASVSLSLSTVAGLPACSSASTGTLAMVTDASAPAYNAALIGGGTIAVPAFCNGTSWTAH